MSGFYTSFFRGTPLIVQLFLIYLALPQIAAGLGNARSPTSLTLSAFQAGVIGLGLNYGAYMTEIFRAGIQSVPHGQYEAAEALGMTYRHTMRRVILPAGIPRRSSRRPATSSSRCSRTPRWSASSASRPSRPRSSAGHSLVGKTDFKNLEALILAALDLLGPDGDLHVLPGAPRATAEQGLRPYVCIDVRRHGQGDRRPRR